MVFVARVMPESSQLNSSVAWGLRPLRSRKWRSTVVVNGSCTMRENRSHWYGLQELDVAGGKFAGPVPRLTIQAPASTAPTVFFVSSAVADQPFDELSTKEFPSL